MDGIAIKSTGSYIPTTKVTNDMFSQIVDTNDEWITTRTGIQSRNFISGHDSSYMAMQAARQAMDRSGLDPSQIGVVIAATFTSEYLSPSLASMVQRELGLPEQVITFDLNSACSGFLYALHTARSLLRDIPNQYALVVACEALSKVTDFTDRSSCVLFGDGAGAVVMGLEPNNPYYVCLGTQGNVEPLYVHGIQNTGTPFTQGTAAQQQPHHIFMNGKEVFRFAVDAIHKGVTSVLEQGNLAKDQIDWYLCHQANTRILASAAKRLDLPTEKFFTNLAHTGNTSAASIPIALDEMNGSGLLQRGMHMILAGFGGGLTYGALYLIW